MIELLPEYAVLSAFLIVSRPTGIRRTAVMRAVKPAVSTYLRPITAAFKRSLLNEHPYAEVQEACDSDHVCNVVIRYEKYEQ